MALTRERIDLRTLLGAARSWFLHRLETRRPTLFSAVNQTRKTVLANQLHVTYTSAERRKGLLGRDGLNPGEGLWIVPSQAVHTFFMRFPLDLVYIDSKHRVRKLRQNVPPGRISYSLFASSVLELAAGTIARSQTRKGDLLEIEALAPRDGSRR